jgi:hypothetical protein
MSRSERANGDLDYGRQPQVYDRYVKVSKSEKFSDLMDASMRTDFHPPSPVGQESNNADQNAI